jgi:hypothetical protein
MAGSSPPLTWLKFRKFCGGSARCPVSPSARRWRGSSEWDIYSARSARKRTSFRRRRAVGLGKGSVATEGRRRRGRWACRCWLAPSRDQLPVEQDVAELLEASAVAMGATVELAGGPPGRRRSGRGARRPLDCRRRSPRPCVPRPEAGAGRGGWASPRSPLAGRRLCAS